MLNRRDQPVQSAKERDQARSTISSHINGTITGTPYRIHVSTPEAECELHDRFLPSSAHLLHSLASARICWSCAAVNLVCAASWTFTNESMQLETNPVFLPPPGVVSAVACTTAARVALPLHSLLLLLSVCVCVRVHNRGSCRPPPPPPSFVSIRGFCSYVPLPPVAASVVSDPPPERRLSSGWVCICTCMRVYVHICVCLCACESGRGCACVYMQMRR